MCLSGLWELGRLFCRDPEPLVSSGVLEFRSACLLAGSPTCSRVGPRGPAASNFLQLNSRHLPDPSVLSTLVFRMCTSSCGKSESQLHCIMFDLAGERRESWQCLGKPHLFISERFHSLLSVLGLGQFSFVFPSGVFKPSVCSLASLTQEWPTPQMVCPGSP